MSFTSSARMLEASCASSRGPITGAMTTEFASTQASAAELSGDLMISATEVPAFRTVARAVKTFQSAHPRVRVHVTSTNGQAALVNLKTGVAHFAVLNAPVELAGLDWLELPEGAHWGVLTRRDGRFAGRSAIGPADLADLPLFVSQQPLITSRLTGWLGFPADELRVVGTYNLLNNMRYIVASGRECLCLSGIVEEDGEVMFLPLEPAMTTYSLFVWPTSTVKDALVDAFRECVRREIEAETKGGAEAGGAQG